MGSLLRVAAAGGNIKGLGLLMERLEDVNAVQEMADKDGFTPLHLSNYFGHDGCTELLIMKVSKLTDAGCKFSPLHCAAYSKSANCLNILLKNLADANCVNYTDERGRTPLHVAAYQNALECAKILVAKGCDVNAKDSSGLTPLMVAVRRKAEDVMGNIVFTT